jgi:uncharacterized metal-binding protein YceD (DUF177 family)
MEKLKNYDIAFTGLKVGRHEFKFEIKQNFFELFEVSDLEFDHTNVIAKVLLTKHNNFLEFEFEMTGTIDLICDISAEAFSHNICFENRILVNFADEYDDSNEDVISIPRYDSTFNIAHQVYEGIILSVPMKKLSPDLDDEALAEFDEYTIDEDALEQIEEENQEEESDNGTLDPRWEALLKLKNNKQTDN